MRIFGSCLPEDCESWQDNVLGLLMIHFLTEELFMSLSRRDQFIADVAVSICGPWLRDTFRETSTYFVLNFSFIDLIDLYDFISNVFKLSFQV
jgi:hypothetical protein